MQKYEPIEIETRLLKFWKDNKIHDKAQKKNHNKKPFYFLDGPPYTSGKVHIGTAWNKALKDCIIRYKRMRGFEVWDRAGYDMHGLPTEGKVQKKLGMKTKEDIEKFGISNFINECKDYAVTNLKMMNKDFDRLGVWMDFDDPYMSIKNEYIEGTWWLVKKAHEKGRLYEGQKTMTWCASCQTALAKHELEYQAVTDKSIFVKFKVLDKENEYLVIWTTTPWTIPFNLGIMAHPELSYVKVKVEDEIWILGKALAGMLISGVVGKDFEILEEFPGEKLKGLKYEHVFEEELGSHYQKIRDVSKNALSVVMSSEYVDMSAGSGLVHMAPGCGPEDYEIGHREGIPAFNTLDETGIFPETMAQFSGLKAKKDDKVFIEEIDKKGALVAKTDIEHDYAFCWRCKQPVIYRTTTQWFFKIEDLIPKMRDFNKKCNWVPDWAGSNQFDSWLANLRDNGITRQRFWGSPLPVWRCEKCKKYVVIGSRNDLKKYGAKDIPDDIHKPWIDEVKLPCKCGGDMLRLPDIMDVWIDAGTASWSCLYYPEKDTYFKKLYPADFILEGKDQIRGWFNLLFVSSMLAMDNMSFKSCYMHGFVNDSQGRKMSKSLGNVISPYEVIDKFGADTLRYYTIGGANPGLDLNYNFEDMTIKRRNLEILWNLHNLVLDLAKTIGKNPDEIDKKIMKKAGDEERYIISRLNSTIKLATERLDGYFLNEIPGICEDMFLDLSRTFIQLVREKTSIGTEEEKELVLYCIYTCLKEIITMFSVVCPFICEEIFQSFKESFGLKTESVHLMDWPKYDDKLIDTALENDIVLVKGAIQAILSARDKAQIGIRWPLKEAILVSKEEMSRKAMVKLKELISNQTNIRLISVKDRFDSAKITYKVNYKNLGPDFGKLAPKIIARLTKESDEAISKKLSEGKLSFDIEGTEIELKEKHLVTEKVVPMHFVEGSFKDIEAYLNKDSDQALQSEGFSREIIRRVQSFRKKAGLEKTQKISLFISCESELKSHLLANEDIIKKKTGANGLTFAEDKPETDYRFSEDGAIKDLKFTCYLDW